MITARVVVSTLLVLGAGVDVVHAQNPGQVGLVMGYPASAGLIWHATDWLAVRPEVSFFRLTSEASTSNPNEPADWQIETGLGALFYIVRDDPFRAYVSPRFSYQHDGRGFSGSLGSGAFVSSSESRSKAYEASGSFGAQYLLGTRFGIFAELGVGRVSTSVTTESRTSVSGVPISVSRETRRTHLLNLRTGVGAVLYF
jgi:hypothetical protein